MVQAGDRGGAGAEGVGFDAQAVEHGEVEVGERGIVVSLEGDVLAVFEASSGEMIGRLVLSWMLASPMLLP